MRRFRKITVDSVEYKWLFRPARRGLSARETYAGQEKKKRGFYQVHYPCLLIVRQTFPKETLRIFFPTTEPFLLNSGLPAAFQGKEVVINLNRPFYVSRVIRYCTKCREKIPWTDVAYLDGIKILRGAGYDIPSFFALPENTEHD